MYLTGINRQIGLHMAQQRLLVVMKESTLYISAADYGLWTTGVFVRKDFALLSNQQILGHNIPQIWCYVYCLYKI